MAQHHDAVGHGQRLFLVVGDIDDGFSQFPVQVLDLDLHLLAQLAVQCTERLVHQDQRRIEHGSACQGHALLLAAAELRGVAVLEAPHAHARQRLGDQFLRLRLRHAARLQWEGDVVAHRHVREQSVALENHTLVAPVGGDLVRALAIDQDLPRRGVDEAGQHHQQRGLARAAGAQQGDEFAGLDLQVDIGHDRVAAVLLRDAAEFHGAGARGSGRARGGVRRCWAHQNAFARCCQCVVVNKCGGQWPLAGSGISTRTKEVMERDCGTDTHWCELGFVRLFKNLCACSISP